MVVSANGRNIALLAIAQAIFMTTVNMNIIVTSLVGVVIAPEPWLATLPLSMLFVGIHAHNIARLADHGTIWP
jgi:hypothetical protein